MKRKKVSILVTRKKKKKKKNKLKLQQQKKMLKKFKKCFSFSFFPHVQVSFTSSVTKFNKFASLSVTFCFYFNKQATPPNNAKMFLLNSQ